MSDNELARRAQQDMGAFTDLFDRFFQPVYRYHFTRIRSRSDAEDLTSETFEKIYAKLHTYKERGKPFSAWVFTIAHHCLVDHVRRNKHQAAPIDDLPEHVVPSTSIDLEKIDRAMLSEQLWEALKTLPETHQQVWSLKLSSDLPHRQIAEVLGLSESNVNVIIHRSTAVLKKRLTTRKHTA